MRTLFQLLDTFSRFSLYFFEVNIISHLLWNNKNKLDYANLWLGSFISTQDFSCKGKQPVKQTLSCFLRIKQFVCRINEIKMCLGVQFKKNYSKRQKTWVLTEKYFFFWANNHLNQMLNNFQFFFNRNRCFKKFSHNYISLYFETIIMKLSLKEMFCTFGKITCLI